MSCLSEAVSSTPSQDHSNVRILKQTVLTHGGIRRIRFIRTDPEAVTVRNGAAGEDEAEAESVPAGEGVSGAKSYKEV